MAFARKDHENGGVTDSLAAIVDGLGRLAAEHLALAKLEIASDAKKVGMQLAKLAVCAPFILVGYGLLCVGLSLFLTRWISLIASLGLVGGINVAAGVMGLRSAVAHMRSRPLLSRTWEELNRSTALLEASAEPARSEGTHGRG